MTDDARRGTRSAPPRRRTPGHRGPMFRCGRGIARTLVLALSASALTGTSVTVTPTPASAAGTVLFDQPFHNNTANGTGSVVLPAMPSGSGTTNFACLTASGNITTGVLRSCSGNLDSQGSGKLRLTNTATSKAGGVFGATSVPTSQGLDVTFNTYQYGGTAADGLGFVLAAVDPANPHSPANIGQLGGGLGYTSTSNLSGMAYGYLGIGLDVYGNFSNSTYQGSGCTNPPYIGTGGTRVPGQIVVRGPGNGTVGYCAINSTASSTSATALALRATTRTAVPVQVGVNPTNTVLTTAAGMTIPAGSYKVVVTLVGGTTKTLTGTLPTVPTGLYPASWLNSNGIPRQLVFGWVGSTGAVTDFHEVDEAEVATISAVPQLTVAQTSYNATTLQAGDPVTYSVVAGVAAGLPETSPVSITQTLPAGTVPVGAYGTGWVCAAPSGRSITCTNGNTPFAAGATLPSLTVVGIVTGGSVTPALIQSTTVATASSVDANPGYSSSTTVGTLPTAPSGVTLSSTLGSTAGGNAVVVSGANIAGATAIEIGTTAEQQAGTPVVLLPCASGPAAGCFTVNGGTLSISSMPARSTAATVKVTVVTQGLASAATYVYAAAPAAPAAPTATAGVTSATVTWTAPSNNGSTITGYVLTPYIGGVAQTPVSYDASATTRTLTGLTPATSYTFTVAAVNAFGTGSASPASAAVVPYTVPGQPVITAVSAGDSAATLTWTAPGNGGSTITGYVVTPYINGVAQAPQTFTGTGTTQTATGLTPGATYRFTVTAQNAAGSGPPSALSAGVVPNPSPSLSFPAPPAGEVGAAYSVPLTVTGGTSPFTWSVSAGALPPGVTLNASTGVLSGTPTTAGAYTFTVKVIDAVGQSATRAVALSIAAQPTLTFPAPPAGEVGVAYSVPLTVTGGTGPFTWSVTAGSLPPGLTVNTATGVLSGTPTTAGAYTFTVKVLDAQNQSAVKAVALSIAAQPTLTFPALVAGQVGVAYSAPLTVTGGTGPFTWSVTAGGLPPGLTLNTATGVLSGTPTTVGGYPFTVQVIDANGQTATRAVTLAVTAGPLVIVKTADLSAAAPGGKVTYTVTVGNTGSSALTGVTVTDPLSDVLDDAAYNADATATAGTVSFTTPTLTWSGNLAAGATVTVTYSVTVAGSGTGNKTLANTVTSSTLGSICPPGGADPRCTATVTVSGLSIVKTAGASTTTPGSTVSFTVTVTNTGQTPYAGASFTDALGGVLDDATYNADGGATTGSVSFTGSALNWIGNLAVGATATVTYSVTVKDPDTGDRTLTGTVTSATPGSTCPAGGTDPRCVSAVTVLIPQLTITNTAGVTTTTPGGVVPYTITLTNTGQTPYTGVDFTIDGAGVNDDATYNGNLTASAGNLALTAGGTGVWTGYLAIGQSVTVIGSITVHDPDTGDRILTTSVTSTAPGSTCPPGGTASACTTRVTVLVPALVITKTANTQTTTPGGTVGYSLTITNSGQTPYTGAVVTDRLAEVLDEAVYNADATASTGTVGFAGSTLTWTGNLAVGATATVTYSVTVRDPDPGDKQMVNTVVSSAPGSMCPAGGTDPRCTTTVAVLVPALTIVKTADTATTTPGSTVHYTVSVTNSGQTPYAGATFTDPLAGVLDDAVYNADGGATTGTVSFTSPNLTWSGDLAVGATATVTYSVTVRDPDPGDALLTGTVVSATPGNDCGSGSVDTRCSAPVPVARLVLSQSYVGSTATPGSVVRLNATFTNTGQTPYTGITVSSPTAGTLDDAIPNGDQTASSGTLVLGASTITWTGNIPVGGVVTLTGTLTVKNPPVGDRTLTGTLVSAAPGNNCPSGGTDPRCTALLTVLVPGLTITKTADTSVTTPGGTVGYTVTVTNSGQTPYAGASFTDALGGVLDDAVYNGDAAASAGSVGFAGSTLTWSGDLAVGATATVTYSVTVNNPDTGDRTLVDTVTSTSVGANCTPASGDSRCSVAVTVLTPALTITKTADSATATPGATVTYTVTATNTGQTPYAGASFTDALGGVLDDAVYNADGGATTGTVSFTSPNLTWSGDLAVGATATVTYSVTVNNPDTGDQTLVGTVSSAAPGNTCPAGGTDSRCTATVEVVQASTLTFVKSAGVTSTVEAGTVAYTVTVTNTGLIPYIGATFTDALGDVLDDATYNGDAAASTGDVAVIGSELTWTGTVPASGSATVTYSVTVRSPNPGDGILTNPLTSASLGGNCPSAGTDPRCTATVTVSGLEIVGTADVTTAQPGGVIRFTGVMTNVGRTPYLGITVLFHAPGALDDAVPNGDQSATSGSLSVGTTALEWTGNIPVGGSVTVTGTLTVRNPDPGDQVITTSISSSAPGGNCPTGSTDPDCTTTVTVLTPELTVTKSANVNATVPGGTVAYTVTVTNSGQVPYTGATVTDPLAGVLDDATYNADATATVGTVGFAGSDLTWTGDLAVGASATVTYSVTANDPGTGDKLLVNSVVSTVVGSTCPPASGNAACSAKVVVLTRALTIAKTAGVASVAPGGTVPYTITVTNSGQVPYAGATFTDALAGVLDDATYNADATASTGTVGFAGSDLTWTGNLAVGASATVTYSVTVNVPDTGDERLTGTVTSATPGSTCPAGGTDPRCAETVLVSRVTIVNSADVVTALPGGTVHYTITITNSGQTPYPDLSVDTLLTGALDNATYNGDAAASAGSVDLIPEEGRLIWRGGLTVGEVVTVTVSMRVNNPRTGDNLMTTAATSSASGSSCPVGGTDPACATAVTVLTPELSIVKTANTATTTPGGMVGYTITVTNSGQSPYAGATFTDTLAGVLTDAVYNGDATASVGTVGFAGSTLTWSGDLAVGATATVAYSVTVRDPDPGDRTLLGVASSSAPGSTCPPGGSASACSSTVTVLIPGLAVSTTADAVTTTPGGTVRFTVTIANTGQTPYTEVQVAAALAGVLDDAVYDGNVIADSGGVTVTGSTLTWSGDLAVGGTATVTYSVTVLDPDPGDKVMRSVVTSSAQGSTCPAGSDNPVCAAAVTVLVPALSIVKTADAATTTPGGTVGYTITVTNSGQTAYSNASVTDSLDGVLTDALYNGDASASTGVVGYTEPTLTWTGALAVGASATITYSITVKDPDTGDKAISNAVTSSSPGSTCPVGGTAPACTTLVRVLVPQLTITKTADTGAVTAGDAVHYTVTLANTGETPYAGVAFADPLTDVLDDAVYTGDATATTGTVTYTDATLTWSGDLAVGATATVTYSVTASYPPPGNRTLTDTVTSTAPGSTCPAGGTDTRCTTTVTVLVPALTITVTSDNSGTIVEDGRVGYTITATNTGEVPYAAATFVDLLAGVLDDATYNGDATATTGTVVHAGDSLTWTGALPVGASTVVAFTVALRDDSVTGDRVLDNRVTSAITGSTCPAGGTDPGRAVSTAVTDETITLTDLTDDFTLSGPPGTTARRDEAVTMTVTTNSFDGYSVTVRANSAQLTAVMSGETFSIPIGNLRVREDGTQTFSPLSPTTPLLVHQQSDASVPGGDAISNDYEVDIPFVPSGGYSATLDYIATAN